MEFFVGVQGRSPWLGEQAWMAEVAYWVAAAIVFPGNVVLIFPGNTVLILVVVKVVGSLKAELGPSRHSDGLSCPGPCLDLAGGESCRHDTARWLCPASMA